MSGKKTEFEVVESLQAMINAGREERRKVSFTEVRVIMWDVIELASDHALDRVTAAVAESLTLKGKP